MRYNKSWADIVPQIGGVPLLEVQEIDYERTREVKDHYGVGAKVVTRGFGNVTDKGMQMMMSFDELKRLEASAPNGDITLIPEFTTTVTWKGNAVDPTTWTDVLTNCRFVSNGRKLKQGDTKHFYTTDLVFAGFNDPQ